MRVLVGSTVLGVLVAGVACQPAEVARTQIEVATGALNGTLALNANCAPYQAKLQSAIDILKDKFVTNPGTMLEALKYSFDQGTSSHPDNGRIFSAYPEYVMYRMAENTTTSVSCPGAGNGSATGPEIVTLSDGILGGTITGIAKMLAHELGHTKSFSHEDPMPDVTYAIPASLENFVANASPVNLRALTYEALLSGVGLEHESVNPGDSFGDLVCPGTRFAAGLRGQATTWPTGLGLICKERFNDSNDVNSTMISSGSGSPWSLRCGAGEVLVGAWGTAHDYLNSVGALCATEQDVSNSSLTARRAPTEQTASSFGNSNGLNWRRQCPPGMAVKGFKGRADGTYVNTLELTCQRFSFPEEISTTWTGAAVAFGSMPPNFVFERAPGRSAAVMLAVLTLNGTLKRLGGEGGEIIGTGASATVRVGSVPIRSYGASFSENPSYIHQRAYCGAGSALVSIVADYGAAINGIKGTCAPINQWLRPVSELPSVQTTDTAWLGGSPGLNRVTMACPRGQLITGWYVNGFEDLKYMAPQCRRF